MTDTSTVEQALVTQEDRDAAAAYMDRVKSTRWSIDGILSGGCDNTSVVQAFARHRIAALAKPVASPDALVEALLGEVRNSDGAVKTTCGWSICGPAWVMESQLASCAQQGWKRTATEPKLFMGSMLFEIIRALSPSRVASPDATRFWLILQEPGCVPERKGSWPRADIKDVLRDFMAANPTAYITVLTVSEDGVPDVQHGAECLQMLDGRSMSTGRKHNASTRAAHGEHASPDADEDALVDQIMRSAHTMVNNPGDRLYTISQVQWMLHEALTIRRAEPIAASPDALVERADEQARIGNYYNAYSLLLGALSTRPVDEVRERLIEALTPSEETEYAYGGEFSWTDWRTDENGIKQGYEMVVPWTTIKEIMAAIRSQALASLEGVSDE